MEMSVQSNSIIKQEGRIQFTREQLVSSFVQVQEASKSLTEKLTGEQANSTKFIHLFSRYTVKPVACDKFAGTRFNVKRSGGVEAAGAEKKTTYPPKRNDAGAKDDGRNLQRWNRGGATAEASATPESGTEGPPKKFTNSNFIKIPQNLSTKEQMEYLMKLQEEKMMKELGGEETATAPILPEESKDEPKKVQKVETPKQESDIPISTLLSKMDEAEEVKAPVVEVKKEKKVEKAPEKSHATDPVVENVKAAETAPPAKPKASKKQKQKQKDAAQKTQQQEVKVQPEKAPEQAPEEEENAWMAESVEQADEKPQAPPKKLQAPPKKPQAPPQVEDLETIRDKLVAVKQAIAEIEGPPAEEEDPDLTEVEAKPKALTKNEKKKLAKQRQRAKKQQQAEEEEFSEDDEDTETYVIKQRPKASGAAPIVPENISQRKGNTSLKTQVGNIEAGPKTTAVDGVTLSSKVAQSKKQNANPQEQQRLAQNNYFVQAQKLDMEESQAPNTFAPSTQSLDDIMHQQEKQEKHNKNKRKQVIEEKKQVEKQTDMRYLFDASTKKTEKAKQAPKVDLAAENEYYRDDIVQARQKLQVKEDSEKKKDEYYINAYGVKKLVNPPPRPVVEKVKGGKKKGINMAPAPSRVFQGKDSDSDSDETIQAKKNAANVKKPQQQPEKEKTQPAAAGGKKKGKKGAAVAEPVVEVPQKKKSSAYDSEDDSDDDEMSFVPKSLQKKKVVDNTPMSKRQQKKLGVSSLAGLVSKSSLKQQQLSNF